MKLKRSLLVFSALLCWLPFSSKSAHANPELAPIERHITVTGTAVTRTTPDTVVWHVTLTTTNKNLVRAKDQSDSQVQAILATTRELGLKPDDVQTGFLDVGREYEEGEYGQWGDFKHFRMTRQVTITQRDTSQFDAVLTGLIKSSDMEVRYTLESSQIQEIQATTRLKAVTSAREKATAMANALDAEIGEVMDIYEHADMGYGRLAANSVLEMGHAGGMDSMGTFAPGSIDVEVSVGVRFELK